MVPDSQGRYDQLKISREVVVVGGGQAGLALGYFLAQQGVNFSILDAADESASAWRQRWDSLTLFTPSRYSALPGLAFPGDPDRYPTRDDVVDYLTAYAARFELPLELASKVRSVHRLDGTYVVQLQNRSYEAEQVVVATGPFQLPRVPAIAEDLDAEVTQLHSLAYRSPAAIPQGRVLVVGGGNTGFQIAEELSRSHEVHLAVGSRQTPLPQRILGRDLFWYLEVTGLIRKSRDTRVGRRMAGRDTLIGSSPRRLRRGHSVTLHGRAVAANGSTVRFADGSEAVANTVIWATGFVTDLSWLDVPVFDDLGNPVHTRGLTSSPGLYFLGLTWQHTRGSALLGWVEEDAAYLAAQIRAFRGAVRGATPKSPTGTGHETGAEPTT